MTRSKSFTAETPSAENSRSFASLGMTSFLKGLLGAHGGELSPSHFFRPQKHLHFRRAFLLFLFLPAFVRSARERLKQGMRLQRLRFKFGMELASDEKRVTRNLDHLDVSTVGS